MPGLVAGTATTSFLPPGWTPSLLVRWVRRGHTGGVNEMTTWLQIGAMLLIAVVAVVAVVIVWRDDHRWSERRHHSPKL